MFDFGAGIAIILVAFAIQTLLAAGFLWLAMKMLGEEGTFVSLIVACVIASIISLVPFIGGLLGLIALIFMITQFTSAGGFTAIIIVIISWALAFAAALGLLVAFGAAAF
ncbi:MAG: hypothetical protein R6U37_07240 [Dehalococcoidia bacterium]